MASQFSISQCVSCPPATTAAYVLPIRTQNAIRKAISITAASSTSRPERRIPAVLWRPPRHG